MKAWKIKTYLNSANHHHDQNGHDALYLFMSVDESTTVIWRRTGVCDKSGSGKATANTDEGYGPNATTLISRLGFLFAHLNLIRSAILAFWKTEWLQDNWKL